MADIFDRLDQPTATPAGTPSQGGDIFDRISDSPSASLTPETDKAAAETGLMAFLKKPSPAWMQPAEKFLREQPLVPKEVNPLYWMGREATWASRFLPEGKLRTAGEIAGGIETGLGEAGSAFTTPANVGLYYLTGGMGKVGQLLISGAFLGQAIQGTPAQWEALKAAPTMAEKARIATQMGAAYLPALGVATGAHELISAPKGVTQQPGPRGFTARPTDYSGGYGPGNIPPPPVAPEATVPKVVPSSEQSVRWPIEETGDVGEPVPETAKEQGDIYAGRVGSTAEVPELEVRPQVGKETPLRPKGAPAGKGPQEPVAPGERAVATEAPFTDKQKRLAKVLDDIAFYEEQGRQPSIADTMERDQLLSEGVKLPEKAAPKEPAEGELIPVTQEQYKVPEHQTMDLTSKQFAGPEKEINLDRAAKMNFSGVRVTDPEGNISYYKINRPMVLGEEGGVAGTPEKGDLPIAPSEDDKKLKTAAHMLERPESFRQPIKELLSPGDIKKHDEFQSQWSNLNFDFQEAIQLGDRDRAIAIAEKQKALKKKMRGIEHKLPDSDIYDVVGVGAGASGQTAGIYAGSEDLKMVVLDVQEPGGASRKTPIYQNVTGVLGQTGRERAFLGRLSAERHGTEFRRIPGIEGVPTQDADGIWTIKIKGLGEKGGGGSVIRARSIIGASGTRGAGAPFPIITSDGRQLTKGQFDRENPNLPITGTPEDKAGAKVFVSDAASAIVQSRKAKGTHPMAAIGGANSAGQGILDMAREARARNFPPAQLIVRGKELSMSGYLQKDVGEMVRQGWINIHLNTEVDHLEPPSPANGNRTFLILKKAKPRGQPVELIGRMPIDSVASFTGGEPVTEWMPPTFQHVDARGNPLPLGKTGFIKTTEDLRPITGTDPRGNPIAPDSGFYVAGSVRSGAINRMVPSEGEGAEAIAHVGDYITRQEKAGNLPRWKMDLRDYFNRDEYETQRRDEDREFISPMHSEVKEGELPEITPQPRPGQKPAEPAKPAQTGQARPPISTSMTGDMPADHATSKENFEEDALVENRNFKPRELTPQEDRVARKREAKIQRRLDAILQDQVDAEFEGDFERLAENDVKISELRDKLQKAVQARRYGKKPGEVEGAFIPGDFSLDNMIKQKRGMNRGVALTPNEMADVQVAHDKIKDANDAVEAYKATPEAANYWKTLKQKAEAYRTGQGKLEPLTFDPTHLAKLSEVEKAKHEWYDALDKDRRARMTWWQKAPDWLLKWRRAFVISGPHSVLKLLSAAVEGTIMLPTREAAGSLMTHLPVIGDVIRPVAERAPREGGFSVRAEALAQSEMWKNLLSDMGKNIRGEKPDFETVFGSFRSLPPELQNYLGYLHSTLKSPLARNEFSRSLEKRMENAARHGVDITEPLVQMELGRQAVEDSQFWRFQNRNAASKVYRNLVSSLERRASVYGVPWGPALSKFAQAELPIVTVPTNILARTFEGVFGSVLGAARLGKAYREGIETLRPEDADLIMRNLKTGSLGLALTAIGFFAPSYFGGFYRPGKKKDPDDPAWGATKVPEFVPLLGGKTIPPWLQDNPFLILPQFGATMRQVMDSHLRKTDTETAGLASGLWSAIFGALSNQPFVRESIDISKAFDPRVSGDLIGEHARSYLIPMAVQQLASMTDPAKQRYPRGAVQHVMMGIPGLREQIPDYSPSPQQLGIRRRGLVPRRHFR